MMLRYFGLILFLGCAGFAVTQENYNLELVAQVPFEEEASDIWGYVDSSGTEYAIVGGFEGTYIYSLEDASQPVLRQYIEGSQSIWRDFKSYGNYIYGVAYRGTDGFLVVNMSNAPNDISFTYHKPVVLDINASGDTLINSTYTRAHNIYIDERGYIFLADCPGFYRGVAVFEIGENPAEPAYVSIFNNNLSHDIMVRNNRAYSSDIFAGVFSIWDVSNINTPQLLGTQLTGSEFTHNAWVSDDGNFLFTTDEQAGAFLESYDISDPTDIKFLDRIQVENGTIRQVIPHNTHYFDGFLVTAHYVDGVVIVDGSRPDNLVEVARYDTYTEPQNGFHGAWGAYPYLPSGNLLVSDIEGGLFIFKPQYSRAAFLEGLITDAVTSDPIQNVEITIEDDRDEMLLSSFSGSYKTGRGIPGAYTVEYYHPLYESIILEINLENGKVTTEDISMSPLAQINFSGQVSDRQSGQPIANSVVRYADRDLILETTTNNEGFYSINGYPGDFKIHIGAWGYKTVELVESIGQDFSNNIELDPGYKDDFILELGWQVTNENVTSGAWVRAIPNATFNNGVPSNPGSDITNDIGEFCFVTGNASPSSGVGDQDLDDGTTILTSPSIDLSNFSNPILKNYIWFYASERSDRDQLRNDTLFVQLVQNNQILDLDTIIEDTDGWELKEYDLSDKFDKSEPFNIQYAVSDFGGPQQGNLVEAGVDGFEITGSFSVLVKESFLQSDNFKINPNPFRDHLIIKILDKSFVNTPYEFVLINHMGQEILRKNVFDNTQLEVSYLSPGIYYGFISSDGLSSKAIKLVKL